MSNRSDPPRCPGLCSAAPPINPLNRREFLARTGNGFGLLALSSLLKGQANAKDHDPARSANPLAAKPPQLPATAKRCIFLFMTGGPSQVDMFDPKPLLHRLDGQPLPPSFGKIHSQFLESNPLCMGSHRKWGKYGQSGLDMSDLVPHLHRHHADDIAVIRSCVADSVIVVWGGEFGRTPVRQQGGRGRDHNATGFTMWMAGGGVAGERPWARPTRSA